MIRTESDSVSMTNRDLRVKALAVLKALYDVPELDEITGAQMVMLQSYVLGFIMQVGGVPLANLPSLIPVMVLGSADCDEIEAHIARKKGGNA